MFEQRSFRHNASCLRSSPHLCEMLWSTCSAVLIFFFSMFDFELYLLVVRSKALETHKYHFQALCGNEEHSAKRITVFGFSFQKGHNWLFLSGLPAMLSG